MQTNCRSLRCSAALCLAILFVSAPRPLRAQSTASLAEHIQKVMDRPVFAHANFGIEFYDIATGKVVYSINANKLFVPASTTKIFTEGTLLAKLGADYRFHTSIYRTGPIDSKGTIEGRSRSKSPAAIPISRIACSPMARWRSKMTSLLLRRSRSGGRSAGGDQAVGQGRRGQGHPANRRANSDDSRHCSPTERAGKPVSPTWCSRPLSSTTI